MKNIFKPPIMPIERKRTSELKANDNEIHNYKDQKRINSGRPSSNYNIHSYTNKKLINSSFPKKRILRSSRRSERQIEESQHWEDNGLEQSNNLNLDVEAHMDQEQTPNPKSHLPVKVEKLKSTLNNNSIENVDKVKTKREKLLQVRKNKSRISHRVILANTKLPNNDLKQKEEKLISDHQVIQEELALLKAKNKIPSRASKKRSLKIIEDNTQISGKPMRNSDAAKDKLNQELKELHQKSKGSYFEKREQRKQQEEKRMKDATNFI